MLKKIAAAILTFAVVFMFCSCAMTDQNISEEKRNCSVPPRMLFLGDSIAAGYGLDGYTDTDNYNCQSYSNILKEKYQKELDGVCDCKMINKAISGSESDDLLEMLQNGELNVQLKDADAVVISIGGNDMLHILFKLFEDVGISAETGTFNKDDIDILAAIADIYIMDREVDSALEHYEVNLIAITDYIHSHSNAEVYVQTLYNPLENFFVNKIADFFAEKIGKFNNIVRENADGNYRLIELAPLFDGLSSELTNINDLDIHPNADGHAVIAEAVDKAFRKTGFSYTIETKSGKFLTPAGYAVISGSVTVLLALVILLAVFVSGHKKTCSGRT